MAQITEIHHDVARAPRYFVQVVYTELQPDSHFVAGQPASPKHVWVRVDLRSGRTADQKRRLLERLTTEVGAIVGVDVEEVWVRLGRADCGLTNPPGVLERHRRAEHRRVRSTAASAR